jgi:hypothetical protein
MNPAQQAKNHRYHRSLDENPAPHKLSKVMVFQVAGTQKRLVDANEMRKIFGCECNEL